MKKTLALLTALLLVLGIFAGCDNKPNDTAANGKPAVVVTIFPEYDWVREIAGDTLGDIDLTLLLDSGVDLHSYQPTVEDIVKISNCDLFVYVGGESDKWVPDALAQSRNKEQKVLNLMDILGENAKEEEVKEGMEAEEKEEEEEGPAYDEHVWLSLKNAALFVGALRDALCEVNAPDADAYRANADAYLAKLNALDGEYTAAVAAAKHKTLLFADRFPFRYLTDDYGLDYYAAFIGCSAETEASFETIRFLATKVDELGLKSVLTIKGGNAKIAETVVASTAGKNQTVLTLDSMQNTTAADVEAGATYLAIMTDNLAVLREALA